jgi:putative transposase
MMPNHVHGIIDILKSGLAGSKPATTQGCSLSEIVRAFKTYSSRKINQLRDTPGVHIWQRGYYEHIIQSENEYHQIGEYVLHNPAKWNQTAKIPMQIESNIFPSGTASVNRRPKRPIKPEISFPV